MGLAQLLGAVPARLDEQMTTIDNWVKGKDNPVIKQAERKAFAGKIMLDTGRVERKNAILNQYVENPRDSAEKQATERPAEAEKPTESPSRNPHRPGSPQRLRSRRRLKYQSDQVGAPGAL